MTGFNNNNKNLNPIGELKSQLNTPKTETRIFLKQQQRPKLLSPAARSKVVQKHGGNYQSERLNEISPDYWSWAYFNDYWIIARIDLVGNSLP